MWIVAVCMSNIEVTIKNLIIKHLSIRSSELGCKNKIFQPNSIMHVKEQIKGLMVELGSYPGLISGGFGKGFVKLVFPTSQYVSSIPLP